MSFSPIRQRLLTGIAFIKVSGNLLLKLRCDSRFQRAFTAWSCVFKVFTLIGSNQGNYFENATTYSKRMRKTLVATQLIINCLLFMLASKKNLIKQRNVINYLKKFNFSLNKKEDSFMVHLFFLADCKKCINWLGSHVTWSDASYLMALKVTKCIDDSHFNEYRRLVEFVDLFEW
jgi:hypothetical protein